MTSSLFQEALADAKQLKEVAEQNAKNAIIEAVTPKIRKFIEDQLLESASRKDDLEEASDEDIDLATDGGDSVDAAASDALAERVQLMRAMSRIVETLTPEESASLIPVVEKMRNASLKPGSAGIPRAVPSDVRSTHIVKENAAMQSKNKMYEVDLDELMSDEIAPEDEGMDLEYEAMHPGHAEDEGLEDEGLEDEIADLYESLSALFEAEDEEGGDEEGDSPVEPKGADSGGMPDDGGEEEEGEEEEASEGDDLADVKADLDDVKAMLQQLLDQVGGGAGGAPEMPEAPAAGAPGTPPGVPAPSPSETVYRVNESALMRELAALREGKSALGTGFTSAKKAKLAGKQLPEAAAEDEGEELDELSDVEGEPTAEGKGGKMPAHTKGHGFSAKVSAPFSETAKTKVMKENRDLKASLVKHAEAINSLRGQLTEMNLFNAKLLYVNRLLQDRDLSDAQRRTIIESLDRARSLREVKLLYKGLSESIGRNRGRTGATVVNESVNRAVSPTSRPLSTSGVRLNEAVEVQRWSVLAGINKA
jgi:hypothetical protein